MSALTVLYDGDGKNDIMTKYADSNIGKTKALRGLFRELVVSVPMVSVLMVDGVCPPAGVLVVSQLCFGGRWRLGGTLAVCP